MQTFLWPPQVETDIHAAGYRLMKGLKKCPASRSVKLGEQKAVLAH